MEKEIKIDVPEGYEIDKENSTFECIKFKPIQKKRFIDDEDAIIHGCWITPDSEIWPAEHVFNVECSYNVYATEKQAKSALAMARLSQIIANDPRFGGAITDEEWEGDPLVKYCIFRWENRIETGDFYRDHHFLAFHTREQCELFLQENRELIKQYLMID